MFLKSAVASSKRQGWSASVILQGTLQEAEEMVRKFGAATGKTSYLRHLMGVLRDTHRFYFVPTATAHVLSSPTSSASGPSSGVFTGTAA